MTFKEKVIGIFDKMKEIFIAKNSNYGDSVTKTPCMATDVTPEKAIRVRISDKVERLSNLWKGEPDKVGESEVDTAIDLANYLIIWVATVTTDKE